MLRYIYFLLLATGFVSEASAQDIIIPDTFFLNAIIEDGHDLNGDSTIQEAEALLIEDLFLKTSESIESLEGIESFVNMKELTTRNLSTLSIDLSSNTELADLSLSAAFIEELVLPVSKLNNLTLDNMPALSSLDLSGQETLTSLFIYGIGIQELDITDSPNLVNLSLDGLEINTIDLSQQRSLEYLDLFSMNLTSIDFKDAPLISSILMYETTISELDLSAQKDLYFFEMYNDLIKSIDDITFHPEARLTSFGFGDSNKVGGFEQIDFTAAVFDDLEYLGYMDEVNTEYSFAGLDHLKRIYVGGPLEVVDLNHMRSLEQVSGVWGKQLLINNGSIEELNLNGSSDLEAICCDVSQIDAVSEHITEKELDCYVNSYCAFTDFDNRSTISGTLNIQQSGSTCPFDKILENRQKINVRKNNISLVHITKPSGEYQIAVTPGDYTTTPVVASDYYISNPGSVDFNVPDNTSQIVNDFDLLPTDIFTDLEVTIIPTEISRPGFTTQYLVEIHNNGTTCITDDIFLIYENDLTSYLNSNITDLIVEDNKIQWLLEDLGPYEKQKFYITMEHNTPMDTIPLMGGETLTFILTNGDNDADATVEDNLFVLRDLIVNSYDPNDITCLEGPSIPESKVGSYVQYLIRFENTGTANATNVVVQDSIDMEKFEFETLEILSASHEVEGRLLPGGSAEFIFADIDLPFDDATNDGFVLFKIKTKDNLVVGDDISSLANIYFDFNFPIVTNLYTTDILGNDVDGDGFTEDIDCDDNNEFINPIAEDLPNNGIDENCDGVDAMTDATSNLLQAEYNIFPNPASGIVHLESSYGNISVKVYDVSGQVILEQDNTSSIDVTDYSSGTYVVEIIGQAGEKHFERLVVLK